MYLDDFLAACCVLGPENKVKGSALYHAYLEWAQHYTGPIKTLSRHRFTSLFAKSFPVTLSVHRFPDGTHRGFVGVGLKTRRQWLVERVSIKHAAQILEMPEITLRSWIKAGKVRDIESQTPRKTTIPLSEVWRLTGAPARLTMAETALQLLVGIKDWDAFEMLRVACMSPHTEWQGRMLPIIDGLLEPGSEIIADILQKSLVLPVTPATLTPTNNEHRAPQ